MKHVDFQSTRREPRLRQHHTRGPSVLFVTHARTHAQDPQTRTRTPTRAAYAHTPLPSPTTGHESVAAVEKEAAEARMSTTTPLEY
jgi:hypothetical protein